MILFFTLMSRFMWIATILHFLFSNVYIWNRFDQSLLAYNFATLPLYSCCQLTFMSLETMMLHWLTFMPWAAVTLHWLSILNNTLIYLKLTWNPTCSVVRARLLISFLLLSSVWHYILEVFLKKINFFLIFSLLQINNFFNFFRSFWCADIKNNFKKIKKKLFWCVLGWEALWKATATAHHHLLLLTVKPHKNTSHQTWFFF
jgi:hypothetical protein